MPQSLVSSGLKKFKLTKKTVNNPQNRSKKESLFEYLLSTYIATGIKQEPAIKRVRYETGIKISNERARELSRRIQGKTDKQNYPTTLNKTKKPIQSRIRKIPTKNKKHDKMYVYGVYIYMVNSDDKQRKPFPKTKKGNQLSNLIVFKKGGYNAFGEYTIFSDEVKNRQQVESEFVKLFKAMNSGRDMVLAADFTDTDPLIKMLSDKFEEYEIVAIRYYKMVQMVYEK